MKFITKITQMTSRAVTTFIMNGDLKTQVRQYFTKIISLDQEAQKESILKIYEEDCSFTNPYMVNRN